MSTLHSAYVHNRLGDSVWVWQAWSYVTIDIRGGGWTGNVHTLYIVNLG